MKFQDLPDDTDYTKTLKSYQRGEISSAELAGFLKKERQKKQGKPKNVDVNQMMYAMDTQIPNMLKDDMSITDPAQRAKERQMNIETARDFAETKGIRPQQFQNILAKNNVTGESQQRKKEQIRANVQQMKQSRYESQKTAQQKRYDQRFAEMDRQKKLKENILKARKNRTATAQKRKPKAPAGTTDSTGPARYGYKGTNNPDKV